MIGFLVLTAGLTIAFTWNPVPDGPSTCSVKILTGISCPGCGLTRSVTAAAHGHLGESIRWHAFGPLVLVVALVSWAALAGGLVSGRDFLTRVGSRWVTLAAVTGLCVLVAYWLIRLVTGTAPP